MRVLTYNIRKGKGANGRSSVGMDQLGHALSGHEADILLCQEVFHSSRTGSSQSGNLAEALGLEAYYGANKFRAIGHHGNTTFTRLPVEHFENHDLSTNRIERRGALYARLRVDGASVHVFNVHLGLNRWQRMTQMQRVGDFIRTRKLEHEPVLIAGDFNDWRRDLDQFIVEQLGFRNALDRLAPEYTRTWHARRPVCALDRIYIRNLKVERAGRLEGEPWSTLSDHLPLHAELRLA